MLSDHRAPWRRLGPLLLVLAAAFLLTKWRAGAEPTAPTKTGATEPVVSVEAEGAARARADERPVTQAHAGKSEAKVSESAHVEGEHAEEAPGNVQGLHSLGRGIWESKGPHFPKQPDLPCPGDGSSLRDLPAHWATRDEAQIAGWAEAIWGETAALGSE
jgi:hypothetical protein